MASGNGSVSVDYSKFAPEFEERFKCFRATETTDVLVDTKTGVQYLLVKPTKFDKGNTTVSVNTLVDANGFPLIDERFIQNLVTED